MPVDRPGGKGNLFGGPGLKTEGSEEFAAHALPRSARHEALLAWGNG